MVVKIKPCSENEPAYSRNGASSLSDLPGKTCSRKLEDPRS